MKRISVLLIAIALSAAAAASVIEGFEHGNKGLYKIVNGTNDNFTIVEEAKYAGKYGARFGGQTGPAWYYRGDVTTEPGNEYYAFVKFHQADNGRIYIGAGATESGAAGIVIAPNTKELMIQDFTAWGYKTLVTTPFTYSLNTWYRPQLKWNADGTMQAFLYDETGQNLLAQTTAVATPYSTKGGLAFRGWGGSPATNYMYLDEITLVPEPASMLALVASMFLIRRR